MRHCLRCPHHRGDAAGVKCVQERAAAAPGRGVVDPEGAPLAGAIAGNARGSGRHGRSGAGRGGTGRA
jgi:hypothetical protein